MNCKKNKKKCKESFGIGLGNVTGGISDVSGNIGNVLTSPISFITDTLGLGNIGEYVKYIIVVFVIIIAIYLLFKVKGMFGSSNNYQQYQPMYQPMYQPTYPQMSTRY